jgi:type I restriction enzyme, S subunit
MKRTRASLGELCALVKGTSPISKTPPGAYPLITTGEEHRTAESFQLDGEAVCIPLISSTGHGHASLKRIHYQTGKFALGNLLAAALVRERSILSPKFLARYLTFNKDRLIVPLMTGAANMSISIARLASVPIDFPPREEQEQLVKLMDKADGLLKLRAQADQRTAVLIPALFHEMFGRHIKAPAVQISHKGTALPKGWRWSRLTDVARLATGHTPSRRNPEYWMGNIPWISLTDIRALDGKVAQETSQMVTEQGIENSSAVKLPKGTVCFSRTASVGFVTVMGREMCTSPDFVNWVCGDELDPFYLMVGLIQAREHLRLLASGSTHKTIYFPTVEQFCIVVPPLSMQEEFAKWVREISKLEARQATSRERLDDLFQSTMHRAFEGAL